MKMKHYFLAILALLMSACGDLMNPIPTIDINPAFSNSGFTNATIVSQNESDTYKMTYARVNGISRELTMNLTVDENALSKYNQENNTDYKLLPSDCYTMPTNAKFEVKSKNANFDITIYSKKLYEAAGSIDAASKYVLPLKGITDEKDGVDANENKNTVLLHINMLASTVTPDIPESPVNLYFAKGSEAQEEITIEAALNFTGIDANLISVKVDDKAPLLESGEYSLLPAANYSFGKATVASDGGISIKGKINAIGLSDENKYILPCYFYSSDPKYAIKQDSPIYYSVNVADLEVSITDASATKAKEAYSSIASISGSVNVTINTMIGSDLSINFSYDPSLISAFNTKNNQNYLTLPEGSVEITNGKIEAGNKAINIPYKLDISKLTLADGKHYLVPLVIQEEDLEMGAVTGSKVIYLDVTKTLVGEYNREVIVNQRTRNVGNTIWEASKCQRAGDAAWDAVIATAQYGFGGDGDWYAVLFSVTGEDMTGMANCKKIKILTFLELIEGEGSNKVTENKSYFNTVTGEVYIDCYVYESWFAKSYKETYSFKRK